MGAGDGLEKKWLMGRTSEERAPASSKVVVVRCTRHDHGNVHWSASGASSSGSQGFHSAIFSARLSSFWADEITSSIWPWPIASSSVSISDTYGDQKRRAAGSAETSCAGAVSSRIARQLQRQRIGDVGIERVGSAEVCIRVKIPMETGHGDGCCGKSLVRKAIGSGHRSADLIDGHLILATVRTTRLGEMPVRWAH